MNLGIESFLELTLLDNKRNIIKHIPKHPSHSFVKNFYNFYLSVFAGVTPTEAIDMDFRQTSGVAFGTYHIVTGGARNWCGNENTLAGFGIMCGTGNTVENFGMGTSPDAMSYKLDTIIANGTGSGQLERAATLAQVVTKDGLSPIQTWSVEWTRYFNNKSGGTITVKEIGVYWQCTSGGQIYMVSRDVLDSPLTILDTGQLKVVYTLSIPISSVGD